MKAFNKRSLKCTNLQAVMYPYIAKTGFITVNAVLFYLISPTIESVFQVFQFHLICQTVLFKSPKKNSFTILLGHFIHSRFFCLIFNCQFVYRQAVSCLTKSKTNQWEKGCNNIKPFQESHLYIFFSANIMT